MRTIYTRVPSDEQVWERDKGLLRQGNVDIDIDWRSSMPSNRDGLTILVAGQQRWTDPADPLQVTHDTLQSITQRITAHIEQAWGARFQEQAAIEIVEAESYLRRCQELQAQANESIGYGTVFQAPPKMMYFPPTNQVLLPDRQVIRIPKDPKRPNWDPRFGGVDLAYHAWDRADFENAFCEELTHSMFRQLRGECGSDFLDLATHAPEDLLTRITHWNEAMAQYTEEMICASSEPSWTLPAMADKMLQVWGDRRVRACYRGVTALAQKLSLAQIAMVDYASIEKPREVIVDFYPDHPHHERKLHRFEKRP